MIVVDVLMLFKMRLLRTLEDFSVGTAPAIIFNVEAIFWSLIEIFYILLLANLFIFFHVFELYVANGSSGRITSLPFSSTLTMLVIWIFLHPLLAAYTVRSALHHRQLACGVIYN